MPVVAIINHRINWAVTEQNWLFIEGRRVSDREAIEAAQRGVDEPERNQRLSKWLRDYKVLRNIPMKEVDSTARILEQLDLHAPNNPPTPAESVELVNQLGASFGFAGLRLSLASKILWCRFPGHIPIYDGFAVRGLKTLSRLAAIPRLAHVGEYAQFSHAWWGVYAQTRPLIERHLGEHPLPQRYPYPVRILDKILWYLGQPGYGV
jgi:hypothetical protein